MRYPSLPRIVIPIACRADWNAMRAIEADGRERLLWLKVALAGVAFWSAVFTLRSWMARPKSNPVPVLVAAPPSPAPEPVTVTIHRDADRPVPTPSIQPKKYRKARAYAELTLGKPTISRKAEGRDRGIDDLLNGF